MFHLSDFILCYFDFSTRKWISLTWACRAEAVPEVTPKLIQIVHPRAGKCCMGNHKEKEKRERRDEIRLWWALWPGQPLGREPALVKQQQLWISQSIWNAVQYSQASISLEVWCLMIQLLPGCQERFGQLFEKHCLPQTALVFIHCLLSGASYEMEYLRKSDPNSKEFMLPLVPPFQRQLYQNRDCLQQSACLVMLKADNALLGNDLSLDLLWIKWKT